MSRICALLPIVALAAACDRAQDPAAIHPRNDARHYGGPAAHAFEAGGTIAEVRHGGRNPRPHRMVAAGVAPSGRSLLVRFVGGCEWLDDVAVTETEDTVAVTLRVAQPAPADDEPCLGGGAYLAARVTLREPLRGRLLVDDSDDRPRPVVPLDREP